MVKVRGSAAFKTFRFTAFICVRVILRCTILCCSCKVVYVHMCGKVVQRVKVKRVCTFSLTLPLPLSLRARVCVCVHILNVDTFYMCFKIVLTTWCVTVMLRINTFSMVKILSGEQRNHSALHFLFLSFSTPLCERWIPLFISFSVFMPIVGKNFFIGVSILSF